MADYGTYTYYLALKKNIEIFDRDLRVVDSVIDNCEMHEEFAFGDLS